MRFFCILRNQGYSARQLKTNNKWMLWIAELVDIRLLRAVTPSQVERAAKTWVATHCRTGSSATTVRLARGAFTQVAKNWLRFLGKWNNDLPGNRYQHQMDLILQHLREDRGYTTRTALTRQSALRPFFNWLALNECAAENVLPTTVADYFVEHQSKNWKRNTIAAYANSLRSFFGYASSQGWCRYGIEESIERPRLYSLSGIPQGSAWSEAVAVTKESLQVDSSGAGSVKLNGKGRKVRFCPLWKSTMKELEPLIRKRPETDSVFRNRYGEPLTRFGVHALVERCARSTSQRVPSLTKKRVSPHTIPIRQRRTSSERELTSTPFVHGLVTCHGNHEYLCGN
jgi:site-specific recombinase XerD